MTKEDIIELAKQAGFEEHQAKFDTRFEPFAKLVAKRTWVGLTDEDFAEVCQMAERGNYLVAFQRIQAKLKQKNGYAE